MATYVAFLRAINVGGFSFPMAELRSLFTEAGLDDVRTYIQSGNVLFESGKSEASLVSMLETMLEAAKGRQIPVVIRSLSELEDIHQKNPFPEATPSKVGVLLMPRAFPKEILTGIEIPGPEELVAHGRQVFIHFPDGMGRSRLKLPSVMGSGTMRNINTIRKLIETAKK